MLIENVYLKVKNSTILLNFHIWFHLFPGGHEWHDDKVPVICHQVSHVLHDIDEL